LFQPQDEPLIKGLILTVVKDSGPEIVANLSPIPEENALVTALHMVSLAGLEEHSDPDESKMLGPLPVKGTSEYKSLYYSNQYNAGKEIKDERIQRHGAKVGVILLFDAEKLPMIRRAAGLIEPYLEMHLNKVESVDDMNKAFAMTLRDRIIEIISKPRLRTFWMDEKGVYEYKDAGHIRQEDDVVLIDQENKKMYIITQKNTSVFDVRKMHNMVNELNFSLYQGAFQVVTLDSFNEIEPLLLKHNITVR
jgi:hypothetical protein